MNNNADKKRKSGGLYANVNMSVKTADRIVCAASFLLLLLLLAVIAAA